MCASIEAVAIAGDDIIGQSAPLLGVFQLDAQCLIMGLLLVARDLRFGCNYLFEVPLPPIMFPRLELEHEANVVKANVIAVVAQCISGPPLTKAFAKDRLPRLSTHTDAKTVRTRINLVAVEHGAPTRNQRKNTGKEAAWDIEAISKYDCHMYITRYH